MQIEALLFDKDGTLFEFGATWEAWAQAFLMRAAKGDRAHAARAGSAIGFDLEARKFARNSVVIAGTPNEVATALEAEFAEYDAGALLTLINEEAARAPQCEAVPLRPFLEGLRARGLRLGVATNDAEAPAMAHLDASGVCDLFDFIAGSDSGHGAKPGPGQPLAFADKTGIAPERIAMVGDSLHDLHAGLSAGMVTLGVLTGLATAEELSGFATAVYPDIGHIPGWLDSHQARGGVG